MENPLQAALSLAHRLACLQRVAENSINMCTGRNHPCAQHKCASVTAGAWPSAAQCRRVPSGSTQLSCLLGSLRFLPAQLCPAYCGRDAQSYHCCARPAVPVLQWCSGAPWSSNGHPCFRSIHGPPILHPWSINGPPWPCFLSIHGPPMVLQCFCGICLQLRYAQCPCLI